MILDLLTVFFILAGFLLLVRLIRQPRRLQAKILVEERKQELEPPAIGARSVGPDLNLGLTSEAGLLEKPATVRPGEERAWERPTQKDYDLSRLISVFEALASTSVQNNMRVSATDTSPVKAQSEIESWDRSEERSLNTPTQGPSVEAQTSEPALEHRNTILSADEDLAEMLRKIRPDS